MQPSVPPSVRPSVPSSTGPGVNPAYTVQTPATSTAPPLAVTGQAAGAAAPVPNGAGSPPAWLPNFARKLFWSPQNPPVDQGDPEALPPGQPANWVQGPIVRGTVRAVTQGATVPANRDPGNWTRIKQHTPNDIQSQDVSTTGWINQHPNDRMDFWIERGADAPSNVPYWPTETSQIPDIAPLSVDSGNTTSSWTPAGVNSAYQEPAQPQSTAEAPQGAWQPDSLDGII